VTVVRDGLAAIEELEKNQYAAALVDWMLPGLDGIEIVRRVAAMKSPTKPRTILTSVIDIPTAREYALAAGAVDFLPKPVAPAKLLEALRLHCANDVDGSKADGKELSHPLARSTAWLELGNKSAAPLSDLLGTSVVAESMTPTIDPGPAMCFAASVVDPSRGCEVLVSVIASEPSTLEIGKQMLGGDSTEAEAEDALAEVVNVVAGVVKAAFVNDGFQLTLSLPSKLALADFKRRQEVALAATAVNLRFGGHPFALSYLVTSTAVVELAAEELHEGYVLAEDLKRNGALLLPACTRLTESAARRVRETCAGTRVKVCPPMRK
jgi:CheY-like chemotaxis protein